MNYMTQTQPTTIAGVARSAMLVDLNISIYSGRKQDKATQGEVTAAKGSASKKAASVYKNLFAECKELDAITKFQARARAEHYRLTMPWNDHGARLLPTAALQDYKKSMNRYQDEFDLLVEAFLDKYDTLVAAAAFQLGTLFDRDEYLSREQVARRFRMELSLLLCQRPVTSAWMWSTRFSRSWCSSTRSVWTRSYRRLPGTVGSACTKPSSACLTGW